MKFIHLADAHLDSPFLGLSFLPSNSFKQIQQAPNKSFTRIVDLALEQQVDLVLIAGDTFDSPRPNPSSQLFFAREIERLVTAKIHVVMIFGNHDHMHKADLLVPTNPYFTLLGDGEQVETVTQTTKTGFTYDISGFSYLNNHIVTDRTGDFPAKTNHYTFGLMHAQIRTSQSNQNVYAPFSLAELKNLNYDYFALGHIHLRQILAQKPLIAYPGNIQGRHINELDTKGCFLGEIDEQTKQTKLRFVKTGSIIWQKAVLRLTAPLSTTKLQEQILAALISNEPTYFSLQIVGAEFLTTRERELVEDQEFWQTLALQLQASSQLVDVRFVNSSQLQIAASDRKYFAQAEAEIFSEEQFRQLSKNWAQKDQLAHQLAQDADFLQEVKQLAEVELNRKLKGISDEIS